MKTKTETAAAKFLNGYNCAQSVLYAFCDDIGFDKNAALKIACGLGAGMGRKQEVCGAVTGGVLVIGLRCGRGEKDDRSATEETYRRTKELLDGFTARHGTLLCRELLRGHDLSTEEGRRRVKEENLHDTVCRSCVETVAGILERMK